MAVRRAYRLSTLVAFAVGAPLARPCSVTGIVSGQELIRKADAVIRAQATDYTPSSDSRIHFKVLEVIRGLRISDLELTGDLTESDDFNDRAVPYTFVRPGGRGGNCFANSYRKGGQFLLFLKRTSPGFFTVNWAALAPVNEQLRSADDPWALWVRQQAKKISEASR